MLILLLSLFVHAGDPGCDSAYMLCRLQSRAPCTDLADGAVCVLPPHFEGLDYDQEIAVLIPSGLRRPARIVLQMHGNRGKCPAVDDSTLKVVADGNYLEQLKQAPGSVMVFPMSRGDGDDYEEKLAPSFEAFLAWTEHVLPASKDTPWIVSGHSGAGRAIAGILGGKPAQVRSALLLDAVFNIDDNVENWKNACESRVRIFGVYTDEGQTAADVETLKGYLTPARTSFTHADINDHCAVPQNYFGGLLKLAVGRP